MEPFLRQECQNLQFAFPDLSIRNTTKRRFKIIVPYKENVDYNLTIALLQDFKHHIHMLYSPQLPIIVEIFLQITQKCIFAYVLTSSKQQDFTCKLSLKQVLNIIQEYKKSIIMQNDNAKNTKNYSFEQIQAHPLFNLTIRDIFLINTTMKFQQLQEELFEGLSIDEISDKMKELENNNIDEYFSKLFMLEDSTDYFTLDSYYDVLKQCFGENSKTQNQKKAKKRIKQQQQRTAEQPTTSSNIQSINKNINLIQQQQKKQPHTTNLNNKTQPKIKKESSHASSSNQPQPKNITQQTNNKKNNRKTTTNNNQTNNNQLIDTDLINLKSQFENLLNKVQGQQQQLNQQKQQKQKQQLQPQRKQQQQQQVQFIPIQLRDNDSINSQLFQIQGLNQNNPEPQNFDQFSDILLYSWIYSQLKTLYLTHYNQNSQQSEIEIYNEIQQLFKLTFQNGDGQETMETCLSQWKDILASDFQTFVKSSNIPEQQQQNSIQNN